MRPLISTIGELSRRTDVIKPIICDYEQMGLLVPPERSEGNQRGYTPEERDRLAFIKHARDLSMKIEAIRELIGTQGTPEQPCVDADQIASEQLHAVREQIGKLRKLERELARIASGRDSEQINDSYVIRALASHDLCEDEH